MSTKSEDELLNEATENGAKISPVLPEGVKNYLIDIDGTVGEDIPNEEPERMLTAEVYPDALATCNKWYDDGNIITFFTARESKDRDVTEQWLKDFGFEKTYTKYCYKISFGNHIQHYLYITLAKENIVTLGDDYGEKGIFMVFTLPICEYDHQLQTL